MPTYSTPQSGNTLVLWLSALALIAAGALLSQALFYSQPEPPTLSSSTTQLQPPRVISDFALVDHQQRPFTLAQLQGQWTFMFFGYTHCPDICPTTLTTLNTVANTIAALPNAPTAPQFTFVTIDPERDTAELLAKYVPYFNPTFIGVTGESAAIAQLTQQLSVAYLKVETPADAKNYLMDHSAAILLLDPQGRLHALMSPPFDTAQMAQDFQKLSQYYEATR